MVFYLNLKPFLKWRDIYFVFTFALKCILTSVNKARILSFNIYFKSCN